MDHRAVIEYQAPCCCQPLTGEATAAIRYEGLSARQPSPLPFYDGSAYYLTRTRTETETWSYSFSDAYSSSSGSSSWSKVTVHKYAAASTSPPELAELEPQWGPGGAYTPYSITYSGTLSYTHTYTASYPPGSCSWPYTETTTITATCNATTGVWTYSKTIARAYSARDADPACPPESQPANTSTTTTGTGLGGLSRPGVVYTDETAYSDAYDAAAEMQARLDYGMALLRAGDPLPAMSPYNPPLASISDWAGKREGEDDSYGVPYFLAESDAIWELDIAAFYANKLTGGLRWRWQDEDDYTTTTTDSTLAVTWTGSGKDPFATHPATVETIGDRITPDDLPDPAKRWTAVQIAFRHRVAAGYPWHLDPLSDLDRFP